jgi:hypothetical protein
VRLNLCLSSPPTPRGLPQPALRLLVALLGGAVVHSTRSASAISEIVAPSVSATRAERHSPSERAGLVHGVTGSEGASEGHLLAHRNTK